jgi:hypothetical protein
VRHVRGREGGVVEREQRQKETKKGRKVERDLQICSESKQGRLRQERKERGGEEGEEEAGVTYSKGAHRLRGR